MRYLILRKGISTDPRKVEAMMNWPKPTPIRALRGFLGLTGYYHKFVKGYGVISKPLTNIEEGELPVGARSRRCF